MSLNNRVPVAFTPGAKKHFPVQSVASSQPTQDQYNVLPWQVSGIFATIVSVPLPAGPIGQTSLATVSIPVNAGWPTPVILKQTDLGAVSLSATPTQFTAANILLGVPSLVLTWAAGSALNSPTIPSIILQPGTTYITPSITLKVQAYYGGVAINPFTVSFCVQAILYGKSQLS